MRIIFISFFKWEIVYIKIYNWKCTLLWKKSICYKKGYKSNWVEIIWGGIHFTELVWGKNLKIHENQGYNLFIWFVRGNLYEVISFHLMMFNYALNKKFISWFDWNKFFYVCFIIELLKSSIILIIFKKKSFFFCNVAWSKIILIWNRVYNY